MFRIGPKLHEIQLNIVVDFRCCLVDSKYGFRPRGPLLSDRLKWRIVMNSKIIFIILIASVLLMVSNRSNSEMKSNCNCDTTFVTEFSKFVIKNLVPARGSDSLKITIYRNCNYQITINNRALFNIDNSTYEVYDVVDSLKPLSEAEAIALSRLYNRILHVWADTNSQLYIYPFDDNWLITNVKHNLNTKGRFRSISINKNNYRLE